MSEILLPNQLERAKQMFFARWAEKRFGELLLDPDSPSAQFFTYAASANLASPSMPDTHEPFVYTIEDGMGSGTILLQELAYFVTSQPFFDERFRPKHLSPDEVDAIKNEDTDFEYGSEQFSRVLADSCDYAIKVLRNPKGSYNEKFWSLLSLASIALLLKPTEPGFDNKNKTVPKPRNESLEHRTFRLIVGELHNVTSGIPKDVEAYQNALEIWIEQQKRDFKAGEITEIKFADTTYEDPELIELLSLNNPIISLGCEPGFNLAYIAPGSPRFEQAKEKYRLKFLALNLQIAIANSHLYGEGFLAQLDDAIEYNLYKYPEVRANQEIPPVISTHWEILPQEQLNLLRLNVDEGEQGSTKREADESKLRFLLELAELWGSGCELAVRNMGATGDEEYRVLLLPQIIDGEEVIHAVGENPTYGNALYVFRAEIGLDPNGRVAYTWRHVFDKGKSQARKMGARRVDHRGREHENVLEFLTRPPHELNRLGFRR